MADNSSLNRGGRGGCRWPRRIALRDLPPALTHASLTAGRDVEKREQKRTQKKKGRGVDCGLPKGLASVARRAARSGRGDELWKAPS